MIKIQKSKPNRHKIYLLENCPSSINNREVLICNDYTSADFAKALDASIMDNSKAGSFPDAEANGKIFSFTLFSVSNTRAQVVCKGEGIQLDPNTTYKQINVTVNGITSTSCDVTVEAVPVS